MKRNPAYTVLYEDDDLLVVDKAAGIAVLADRWDDSKERLDELLNADIAAEIAAQAPGAQPRIPFPHRVFVIHRIDRDTSGLVAFAKTAKAHRDYSTAFESRSVHKSYIAVVQGRPAWDDIECELPLKIDGDRLHRTIVDKHDGKPSYTRFRLLGTVDTISLVEALPSTGRTHQIRAHLAAIGHPIVCDPLYGSPKPVLLSSFKRNWRGDPFEERPLLARLGLHAARLQFTEPRELSLVAKLPRDLSSLVKQMEKTGGESFGIEDLL